MTSVNTEWRQARAAQAAALAAALEDTLAHILNVEDALDTRSSPDGVGADPVLTAGYAYAALLRSKVSELRTEAADLGAA